MTQKTHHYTPSKFESKTRRAGTHQRQQKVGQAKDQDWKRDVLDLLGYTNKPTHC